MRVLETAVGLIVLLCDQYLTENGISDSLEKFPALTALTSRLTDDDVKRWAYVTDKKRKGGRGLEESEKRYLRLLSLMGDDNVLHTLLDLCAAVFVCPEFDAYLTHYFGYPVNIHIAYALEGEPFPDEADILDKLSRAEIICDVDRSASPLQYAPLWIDEKIFSYLSGDLSINPRLADFTELFRYTDAANLNAPFVNLNEIRKGEDFFAEGGKVLQLCGRGGRRYAARQIAAEQKRDQLFLNIADLFADQNKKTLKELTGALIREARLDGAGICIYGISDSFINGTARPDGERTRRDLEMLERLLFAPVTAAGIPLILISDKPQILMRSLSDNEYRIIELPERPDYADRLVLWKGFDEYYGLGLKVKDMAERYHLNASECAGVIRSFLERREKDTAAGSEELLSRISIERLGDNGEQETGRIIYPGVKLEDVKVKADTRTVLNDVVNSVRVSSRILDHWGLRENYPYGRCVSLLLSGPPGTGKTMTANAIAGELGLPLYQVNISNIVDKYIGETEKNLEKAFSYAEKTDLVLFFDEADSIFGTRSEVREAKDRYANTEISYLLQRIEAYDGIVIMATNNKGNVDPAFIRRIRYVVNFVNPDEELRKQIWAGCLKDSIPHGDIDIDYLATQFDKFTGSVIKTVFLNACAYAAGRDEELMMKHLIHAIKYELEKTTSVGFTMDTIGKYAHLL